MALRGGSERQILAARAAQEIPTWPVLIQREIKPLYTGWSTTGLAIPHEVSAGQASDGKEVALYAVEPTGGESNGRQGASPPHAGSRFRAGHERKDLVGTLRR